MAFKPYLWQKVNLHVFLGIDNTKYHKKVKNMSILVAWDPDPVPDPLPNVRTWIRQKGPDRIGTGSKTLSAKQSKFYLSKHYAAPAPKALALTLSAASTDLGK
jgi:hypothetical protein